MTDPAAFLQDAVDRNAPAALSVGTVGRTRPTRSRLLAMTDAGLWVAMPAGQADAVDAMIRAGDAMRLNFKYKLTNVEATAAVLERRRAFPLNATTFVEAVRLAKPQGLKIVQRRSAYRVGVSRSDGVRLRFWRVAAGTDLDALPPDDAEMSLDVHDFSAAGAGGVWKRRRGEPSVLDRDQRLRVAVEMGGESTVLDAYVRFLAPLPEPENRRIGVQFMINPMSVTDRSRAALLHKITGELQRAELKRLRVAR